MALSQTYLQALFVLYRGQGWLVINKELVSIPSLSVYRSLIPPFYMHGSYRYGYVVLHPGIQTDIGSLHGLHGSAFGVVKDLPDRRRMLIPLLTDSPIKVPVPFVQCLNQFTI
jgi:hypothetical protein